MKFLFSILLFFVFSCATPQDNWKQKTDSVTRLIQQYYNKKDYSAIYAMAGEKARKEFDEKTFAQIMDGLNSQLGNFSGFQYSSSADKVNNYKAFFANAEMKLMVSLDSKDKFEVFYLQQPDLPSRPRTELVGTNNPLNSILDKKVDSLVVQFMKNENTVGLVLGVLKDEKTYVYGYGETQKGNKKVPDEHNIFEIGSISKTFTATLLAYYIGQGKVKADDPINKYLPDSINSLEKNGKKVTLQSLSNHSSGLPRLPGDLFREAAQENPYAHYDNARLFGFLRNYQLTREPGAQYEYSNMAVGLLGVILERVTGKPYEQLLKEIIFQPLGMKETMVTIGKKDSARFTQGYSPRGEPAHSWEFISLTAAGGIRSTVNDMLLYAKGQLGDAIPALQNAIELTHQPTFAYGQTKVGLGWHFSETGEYRFSSHNGQTGGYCSSMVMDRKNKIAVVILTNASVDAGQVSNRLINWLEKN